jgi:hypothetical protein
VLDELNRSERTADHLDERIAELEKSLALKSKLLESTEVCGSASRRQGRGRANRGAG